MIVEYLIDFWLIYQLVNDVYLPKWLMIELFINSWFTDSLIINSLINWATYNWLIQKWSTSAVVMLDDWITSVSWMYVNDVTRKKQLLAVVDIWLLSRLTFFSWRLANASC